MVGAVKKWQMSDPQNSLETWRKLSEGNSALEMHFNTLHKLAERNYNVYEHVINACSLLPAEKVKILFVKIGKEGHDLVLCRNVCQLSIFITQVLFTSFYP